MALIRAAAKGSIEAIRELQHMSLDPSSNAILKTPRVSSGSRIDDRRNSTVSLAEEKSKCCWLGPKRIVGASFYLLFFKTLVSLFIFQVFLYVSLCILFSYFNLCFKKKNLSSLFENLNIVHIFSLFLFIPVVLSKRKNKNHIGIGWFLLYSRKIFFGGYWIVEVFSFSTGYGFEWCKKKK